MTKTIRLVPNTKFDLSRYPKPLSSKKFIPEWYKDMPRRTYGDKSDGISQDSTSGSNLSLKGCIPFLDSLTSGYMFVTPCDLEVRINPNTNFYMIRWLVDYEPVSNHSTEQAGQLPKASEFENAPFKWQTGWRIETPRGYSAIFTHPLNRHDLPFRTFSGIVDTDIHKVEVNFPFQLLESESYPYVIPANTPVAQVIPFKRDHWVSIEKSPNDEKYFSNVNKIRSYIANAYRDLVWIPKKYK